MNRGALTSILLSSNATIRIRSSRITAEEICSKIGKVVKSVGSKESGGDGFIRVRVIVDVTQPLCRGRVVTLETGKKTWISFKYKRLPNLCYWCGCLDHDDKDCEIWVQNEGNLDASKKKYDSSIRAKPVYQSSKNVVHVPGYFEGRKKEQEKSTPMSSSRTPASRQNPPPRPPTPASPENVSETYGDTINADVTSPLNGADCDPVIDVIPLHTNNGKEDFLEIIKDIDKDMGKFELSKECNNSHATSATPPLSGPILNPAVPISKPTRWTRINRPTMPHESSPVVDTLGKHSSSLPIEEHST